MSPPDPNSKLFIEFKSIRNQWKNEVNLELMNDIMILIT